MNSGKAKTQLLGVTLILSQALGLAFGVPVKVQRLGAAVSQTNNAPTSAAHPSRGDEIVRPMRETALQRIKSRCQVDHATWGLVNYFQDMRHSVSASFMNVHGRYRTRPGDWEYQQEKKLQAHQIEKEKTLIFGQRTLWAAGTTGGAPLGTCRGLYYWLTTNVTAVGAALTQAVFDTFLEGVMVQNTHPTQDWWLLCSSRIHRQIGQWFQGIEREQSSQTLFGVRVQNYRAPSQKDVKLVVHPLFDTEGFDDLAILVNMGDRKAFKYVYHSVFDTKKYTIDAFKATGLTCLEVMLLTIFTLQVSGEWINGGILEGVA